MEILGRVFLAVAFFLLGAILGSYLITYWSRYRTGRKILETKHCFCFGCGKELKLRDMYPIFSYLVYRGKCRYCSFPIGRGTLLCEVVGGLLLLPVILFTF